MRKKLKYFASPQWTHKIRANYRVNSPEQHENREASQSSWPRTSISIVFDGSTSRSKTVLDETLNEYKTNDWTKKEA